MAWNINLLSPATNVLDIASPAKLQPLKQFFFTFYITDAENNLYILKISKQFLIIPTEN